MKRFEMVESVIGRLKDRDYKLMEESDYKDHVDAAVLEYSTHKSRYRVGTLTLVADQADYAAPLDFMELLSADWGDARNNTQPWDGSFHFSPFPDVSRVDEQIHFDPSPTVLQITAWGASFKYKYRARHIMDDATTTIPEQDDIMVRLAALASACKEIASDCEQGHGFIQRYLDLGKRYHEQFKSMIHTPRPIVVRS